MRDLFEEIYTDPNRREQVARRINGVVGAAKSQHGASSPEHTFGVLRQRVAERGLPLPVEIDSAGTHGYHHGAPPDPRAQAAALRRGVDISALRARRVVQRAIAHV